MYQKAVALQPQIVALMKKYTDQKAELEHIHLGFVKASRQYAKMTQPQQQAIPAPYPEQLQAYPGESDDVCPFVQLPVPTSPFPTRSTHRPIPNTCNPGIRRIWLTSTCGRSIRISIPIRYRR